ncbi:MAG: hypothetical protein JSS49_08370 [Planctomycetes bacterium]|nr:hypothetical protein [Planctomycetota bacterium]
MTARILMGIGLLVIGVAALPSSRLRQWGCRVGMVLVATLLISVLGLSVYGLVHPENVAWLTGPDATALLARIRREAQEQPLPLWLLLGSAAALVSILNGLRHQAGGQRPSRRIDSTLHSNGHSATVQQGQAAMRRAVSSELPRNGEEPHFQRAGLRIDELLPRKSVNRKS